MVGAQGATIDKISGSYEANKSGADEYAHLSNDVPRDANPEIIETSGDAAELAQRLRFKPTGARASVTPRSPQGGGRFSVSAPRRQMAYPQLRSMSDDELLSAA